MINSNNNSKKICLQKMITNKNEIFKERQTQTKAKQNQREIK